MKSKFIICLVGALLLTGCGAGSSGESVEDAVANSNIRFSDEVVTINDVAGVDDIEDKDNSILLDRAVRKLQEERGNEGYVLYYDDGQCFWIDKLDNEYESQYMYDNMESLIVSNDHSYGDRYVDNVGHQLKVFTRYDEEGTVISNNPWVYSIFLVGEERIWDIEDVVEENPDATVIDNVVYFSDDRELAFYKTARDGTTLLCVTIPRQVVEKYGEDTVVKGILEHCVEL